MVDFEKHLKSTQSAIAALDELALTSDPSRVRRILEDLGKHCEGIRIFLKPNEFWPKAVKHPNEFKVFREWVNSLEAFEIRAGALDSKLQVVTEFQTIRARIAGDYKKITAQCFPPDLASRIDLSAPDEVLTVLPPKGEREGDHDEFTPVVRKGKRKEQRAAKYVRITVSPPPSDIGSDIVGPDEAIPLDLPRHAAPILLGWHRPAYAAHLPDGSRVKSADVSPAVKATLKWLPTEEESFYPLTELKAAQLLELRNARYITHAAYVTAYKKTVSEGVPISGGTGYMLSLTEATAEYGGAEVERARACFWAAQAEVEVQASSQSGKGRLITRLFNELLTLSVLGLELGEAGRLWHRFIRQDLERGSNLNKSVTTMRNSLLATWRPGEARSAYLSRMDKTLRAVWGKQAPTIVTAFKEQTVDGPRPKAQTTIEGFVSHLQKPSVKRAQTLAGKASQAAVKVGKTFAAAAASKATEAKAEALQHGPVMGYGAWFRAWFSGQAVISVRGAAQLRKQVRESTSLAKAWLWVKQRASSVVFKTIEVTPHHSRRKYRAYLLIPRIGLAWTRTRVTNGLRWVGRQLTRDCGITAEDKWETVFSADDVLEADVRASLPGSPASTSEIRFTTAPTSATEAAEANAPAGPSKA